MALFGALFCKQLDCDQPIICPNDATVIDLKHARDMKCPKCGTTMEPLEGFYDRHPEFREQD